MIYVTYTWTFFDDIELVWYNLNILIALINDSNFNNKYINSKRYS